MDIYLTAIIWRESFYGGEKEIAGDLMAPIKAKTKINNMATGLIVTTEYCIYHQASWLFSWRVEGSFDCLHSRISLEFPANNPYSPPHARISFPNSLSNLGLRRRIGVSLDNRLAEVRSLTTYHYKVKWIPFTVSLFLSFSISFSFFLFYFPLTSFQVFFPFVYFYLIFLLRLHIVFLVFFSFKSLLFFPFRCSSILNFFFFPFCIHSLPFLSN